MRKLIISAALASALCATAHAGPRQKFSEDITLPANQAVKITVTLSEDLAHRATHIGERKRAGIRTSFNSGFATGGFLGERDLTRLQERLRKDLTEDLGKQGVAVSDNAPYELRVTLTDARPNRPTFAQLSKQTNLSYDSRALGGASLEGVLVDSAGTELGRAKYGWYETNLEYNFIPTTWSDANRAIGRFASRTAKGLLN